MRARRLGMWQLRHAPLSRGGRWRGRRWALLALDVAALAGSVVTAYWLRVKLLSGWLGSIQSMVFYVAPGAVLIVVTVASLAFNGLYEDRRQIGRLEEHAKTVSATFYAALLATALAFFFKTYLFSRGVLVLFWLVASVGLVATRALWHRILGRMRVRGFDELPVAVVAPRSMLGAMRRILARYPMLGYRPIRLMAAGRPLTRRNLESLEALVRDGTVDGVILGFPANAYADAVPYFAWCEEHYVPFHRLSAEFDMFHAEGREPPEVLYAEERPLYRATKRAFDLIGAAAIALLTLPLWVLAGVLIKLESPGPVLFAQERVGKNGRHFRMYKFRTMHAHAPRYAPTVRRNGDPRVTRVGGWLRRTSLDELPQLLNVTKGEMSLVGPRPEMPFMAQRNGPEYRLRLAVPPGLTGLWQATARHVPLERALDYDLHYIRHRSLLYDLTILARTPFTVLSARGAK